MNYMIDGDNGSDYRSPYNSLKHKENMTPQTEALSVLNEMPSNKDQALSFAELIISQVDSGQLNPLKLKAQMKWIEKTLEIIDEATKEQQLDEAAKHGKSFDFYGFEVSTKEAGIKYDFSNTGDIDWEQLDQQLKSIAEAKKAREAMLKALKAPLQLVNESTGEVYEVRPPVKTSTTTLNFKML